MQQPEPIAPEYGAPPGADARAGASTFNPVAEFPSDVKDRILSSANWFFWIAALSLINSAIAHSGSDRHFILGLGITAVADAIALQFGGSGVGIALVFDVMAASAFVAIGLLARRMWLWPFVVGMAAYALDGALLVFAEDYLSAAFHGYALFCIFLGFNALRDVRSKSPAMA
jgi:hypothetical protein